MSTLWIVKKQLELALELLNSACAPDPCAGGGSSESIPVAGANPQAPVDFKEVALISIISTNPVDKVIGYMIAAGDEVRLTTLNTEKGNVRVVPGTELWFSATNEDVQVDVTDVQQIKWEPRVFDTASRTGWTDLKNAIDGLEGLVENEGKDLTADATGPSNYVMWTNEEVDLAEVTTFTWTDVTGSEWRVSLAQEDSVFSNIVISTTLNDAEYFEDPQRLPIAFKNGDVTMDVTAANDSAFKFDAYFYA